MLRISVDGYREAKAILDQLPNNMQKKMLLAALRSSLRPMLSSARSKVPIRSGRLKKQLRIVRFKDRSAPKSEVDVALKHVFGKYSRKGTINEYYGKFIHEGTKDPRTPRKKDRILAFKGEDGQMVFTRAVKGLKAKPYLEEAYRENSERVISDFGDELATAVEKFVNKNFK